MKRCITYTTADGQTFKDRKEAVRHEIAVIRRQRLSTCLRQLLKAADEKAGVTVGRVVDVMAANPDQFTDALSARAAAREALKRGGMPSGR